MEIEMLTEIASNTFELLKPFIKLGILTLASLAGLKALWVGLKMFVGNIKDKIIKGL